MVRGDGAEEEEEEEEKRHLRESLDLKQMRK